MAAKRSPTKKSTTPKKSAAKRATAKRATAKKAPSKKAPSKKVPAKKAASRKTASKKPSKSAGDARLEQLERLVDMMISKDVVEVELDEAGARWRVRRNEPQAVTYAAPAMQMAMVSDCEFEAQTSSAIQLRGTGNDSTKLMVRRCSMRKMPVGFRMDDQTANGTLMSDNEHITMDGVGLGCSFFAGGSGQVSMWSIWRSSFINGETLAKSTRSPTATQLMMLRVVYTDAICTGDVIDMEGTSAGTSMVHHHHSDWVAGPNDYCLRTHPRTAQFDVHGSEMSFDGNILMAGGNTSPRFWHQNNEYKNGTITFDIEGALPNLVWNRYENCSINVPTLARSPVVIRDSQLIGTNIDSQSFLAPANLSGCYRSGSQLSGFANESDTAPVPFLGSTEVTPREPQVGASLNLSADLPSGISLVWDIAESYSRPTTSTEPIRLYGDPNMAVLLPIVVIFQSTVTVPIPTTPALVGQEFYAQGIALPWFTMSHAPAYQLPRGGRIYIQP